MNPYILAYATPSYADEMTALKATASELGLKVHDVMLKDDPGWNAAVCLKPQIILDALESLPAEIGGVLYTDADSRFRRVPEWQQFVGSDFACHFLKRSPKHESEMLTGTLWFGREPHVVAFVKDWVKTTSAYRHTDTPEQRSLAEVFQAWCGRLNWVGFVPGMCYIWDDFKAIYGPQPVYIEHLQASRRMRR